ncbi:C4-dicarboxylate TRAP transporter substrate-binding protein [Nitratireductor sp. XY-223]|uniref:C4-dicarboxylate TRAP transporter substrate-binding protein n=1 Tax=Nitratireductor sp. XY-223 TaxID=2561926 RepID=UPI00197CE413|nr:C4-dicarboxylate TRAP transporter substrate-binding protein [Nitratireductor sp. XY-223]
MKRLSAFTLSAAMIAGAGGAAFAGDAEDPRVQWNFSVWGKQRALTAGIEKLAEIVSEKTDGQFTIKIHYGGALSKPKENLDGIKLGAFQSTLVCHYYHPGKNPPFMVFQLPFLPLGDPQTLIAVSEALYQHPDLVSSMDRWNAMVYASTVIPSYEFMGTGSPPLKLEDWDGMRVRAGGGLGKAMEILGATRTTMPGPEVYTALQRGTVDAISFPYTYAFAAFKIDDVSDWYTSNLAIGTIDCPIVFNKDAWADLPEHYKQIVRDAKPAVLEAEIKAYQDHDEINIPQFEEKLQKIVYSDEDIQQLREAAGRPVWDEWVAENKDKFDAQGILDLVFETANKTN